MTDSGSDIDIKSDSDNKQTINQLRWAKLQADPIRAAKRKEKKERQTKRKYNDARAHLISSQFRRRQRIKTSLEKDRFESGLLRLSSELYISATHRLLLAALQNRIKLWVEPAAGEMTLLPVFESASILDVSEHIDKLLEFAMTALQCGDFAKYDEFLQTRRIWEKKMREGAEMEASLASVFSNVTGAIKDALFPTAMRIGRVKGVLQTVL